MCIYTIYVYAAAYTHIIYITYTYAGRQAQPYADLLYIERGREGGREGERERESQPHIYTHAHTHRHRDTETQTQTQRHTYRYSD